MAAEAEAGEGEEEMVFELWRRFKGEEGVVANVGLLAMEPDRSCVADVAAMVKEYERKTELLL